MARAVPAAKTIKIEAISMAACSGGGQGRDCGTPEPEATPQRLKHHPARRVWPQCSPGVAARARGGAGSRQVSQSDGLVFPGARGALRGALVGARAGPESKPNPTRLVSGGAGASRPPVRAQLSVPRPRNQGAAGKGICRRHPWRCSGWSPGAGRVGAKDAHYGS